MKVYAVINQKGGVGKTTTVANLGAAIAAKGHSVCLIDLDPQAHLTLHFGVEPGSARVSVYDVIIDEAEIASAAMMVAPNLWLVPSTIDLAAAEVELAATVGREQILRDRVAAAGLPCELAMIDCPPSLGLLTLNALAAADEVVIPLQPHFLALQGLGKLLETVSLVQRRITPKLRVAGVIFCLYETTTRLAGEVAADLAQFLDSARGSDTPWSEARVFQTHVRRNVKLAECPSHGQTIFDYDPASHGAEDYRALAEEFLTVMHAHEPAALASAEPAPQGEAPEAGSAEDQSSQHAAAETPAATHNPTPDPPPRETHA